MKRNKTNYPDSPGVYFFKQKNKILYIGKATSLKDRINSYFNQDVLATRGPKIEKMVALSDAIDFQKTDSVLEALILESFLIKKYQPAYNTREKDGKSFWSVVVTKEDFPQVLLVRGSDLILSIDPDSILYTFGPFPHGGELKEAMKIIRRIFPYRDAKCIPGQGRPCFNRQIGLCPGVCTGEVSRADYTKTIRHLKLFFDGKKTALLSSLERDMKNYAKRKYFEQSAIIRNQIFALSHIRDVALIKNRPNQDIAGFRVEAFDIAHISGQYTVGVMTVVLGGELDKNSYRKFALRGATKDMSHDTANLQEILTRRLDHEEWRLPDLIVVDGGKAQVNAAEKVLRAKSLTIPIVSVLKDEHHKPKDFIGNTELIKQHETEILLANSEAHRFALVYHRNRRGRMIQ